MSEKSYRIWNLSVGWMVFAIALFTFGSTVEPTASFWDSGEYIATSAKLQIGHPPGAPFFQMMGAFFALFASEPENIALGKASNEDKKLFLPLIRSSKFCLFSAFIFF